MSRQRGVEQSVSRSSARFLALALGFVVPFSACSSGDEGSTDSIETSAGVPTTPPVAAPTSTRALPPETSQPSQITEIDTAFLVDQAEKSWDSQRPGGVLIIVFDAAGESVSGAIGTDANGEPPSADDVIRVGSITKLLTSTTVLSLVDDGLVDLDAPVSQYLARVDIDDRVTVRDALQHSSGLPDYTDIDGYLPMLVEDPSREWTPEEVFDLGRTEQLDFDPGADFAYSNTNYIALGLVIEEVTGQAYHQLVRERIIDPLGMSDTYLEHHEQGREPVGGYTGVFGEIEPVAFDFTSIATNEWSAGGIVSSGQDLHRFMSALFANEIISSALLLEMTQNPEWGFGIFEPEWTSQSPLLGHDGRTLGSGTFLVHAPETGMTVFTFANADHLRVSPATGDVAELIGVQGVSLVADD